MKYSHPIFFSFTLIALLLISACVASPKVSDQEEGRIESVYDVNEEHTSDSEVVPEIELDSLVDSSWEDGELPPVRSFLYGLHTILSSGDEVFLNPDTRYPFLSWDITLVIRHSLRQPALEYLVYVSGGELFATTSSAPSNEEGKGRTVLLSPISFEAELSEDYALTFLQSDPEENVLYGMYSIDGIAQLSTALMRFTPYTDPEMLNIEASSNIAIELEIPSWLILLGNEEYEVEIQGATSIQRRVFSPWLDYDDFEFLYTSNGEYEYRIRPLSVPNQDWTSWKPFSTSTGLIRTDNRPLDYYDFRPGIEEDETADQPINDERFSSDSEFNIMPGRLPVFFLFELSNAEAVDLLNSALIDGELSLNENQTGDKVIVYNDIVVLGLGNLYYGRQFGLDVSIVNDSMVSLSVLPGYAEHPLTGVTWFGALYLANRLSVKLGMEPVYILDRLRWDRNKRGVRLPTEMEWELYARLGEVNGKTGVNSTINYFRSYDSWEDVIYPYNQNGGPTTPVSWREGSLLGNVWEWCWDLYNSEAYSAYAVLIMPFLQELTHDLSAEQRKQSLSADGLSNVPLEEMTIQRVLRGGAWNSFAEAIRVSNRGQFYWDATSWSVGLRLVVDRF